MAAPARHTATGIALMVGGTLLFSAMDAVVKWLVAEYSVIELLFFRSAFGLVPLLPLLMRRGPSSLATTRPGLHLVRAAIGVTAISSFFFAFRHMPLANATAIGFAAPLLMTALSVPVLGERVGARRWAAVALGFAGVLAIARPGAGLPGPAVAAALAGTVLYAVVMVLMRAMGRTESSLTTVFWFTLACTGLSAVALPFVWEAPGPADLGLFAAAGLLGGTAQLMITRAVRLAPVSVVAPFDYLHIVGATGLGWLVFGDVPTASTLLGAAVIAACGLYVVRAARGGADRG